MPLTLSFDIGYASIGWCVLSANAPAPALPDILGTGVVTFPTDDCLASTRRALRRTRRHIRSTRQRIERMKRWLLHRGVLSRADLDKPGHPAPFLLAAAALEGHRTLNAWELWTVLRWYAHNRGYDGNSRWANDEDSSEDTEKVVSANALMEKHGTEFMCTTVCSCLGLDPVLSEVRISSTLPYKTLNAAYPRKTVVREVSDLLSKYMGKIPGLDAETVRYLLKNSELDGADRTKLESAGIKLPKRYFGGLLFGQLIPRFDNRIIARCPITWAKVYDLVSEKLVEKSDGSDWHAFLPSISMQPVTAENSNEDWLKISRKLLTFINKGLSEDESIHEIASAVADKFAKVPAAKSKEFLEYRFARILANIKADGKPIDKELRNTFWQLAEKHGRLTHSDLQKGVKSHCGDVMTNLDAYFKLHPDSEEALVLEPVMDEVRKAEGSRARLSPIWKLLPESVQNTTIAEWRKGKSVSLAWMLEQAQDSPGHPALVAAMEKEFADLKPKRGAPPYASFNEYLLKSTAGPKIPTGRAPYARPVLRQVVDEVKNGWDATKANKVTDPENGEDKPENGVLYDLGIPSSRVRVLQGERPLDKLTNNHLVRHRLLILERLVDDLADEFVTNAEPVGRLVVEVARELGQFSGMTAKQIASELNSRLKDFKGAVDYLEKHAPDLRVNGSIIRKCRIAMDMNWCCPFTGEKYDAYDLPKVEREHIIPYATRNTNALHALVLTWPEINRMKGKRTARQFILEDGSKTVPGKSNLSLFTIRRYDEFVDKLDTKGHPDDGRRKRARKALLATTDFEDKELGFTDGALTKTSHLMKLAMRGLSKRFPQVPCEPVPGAVTSEIRKAWNIFGTLALACPEIIDSETGEPLPKNDVRGLTHMHHALDAATIALAVHYFPLQIRGQDQKGKIWQALTRRRRTPEEKDFLYRLGIFDKYQRVCRGKDGKDTIEDDVRLKDLPKVLKERLSLSLAECRVAQHIPADQSGTKAEQTTWSILGYEGKYTIILQRINRGLLETDELNGKRQWKDIPLKKEAMGLLEKYGDKLNSRQRSLVKRGLLKMTKEPTLRLLGPNPTTETSKLQQHRKGRGAIVIEQNYGIAIYPTPTLIPFHNVNLALKALKMANGGKHSPILRNGTLIRVMRGTWKGCWRITSVKNSEAYGLSVDLATFQGVKMAKGNAKVPNMIRDGMEILPRRYTGYPVSK